MQILAPADLQGEAEFLRQYLKEVTWNDLPIVSKRMKRVCYIELSVSPAVKQREGYILTVSKSGVTIQGGSAAGVFYGIQTLRKALLEGPILNPVIITDAPRFSWRGMHLDCSRHFFSVAFVKKYIDLLAMHNMNVFHWHLTDDQGWRIEIKKWPKLISVGSSVAAPSSAPIPTLTTIHPMAVIIPSRRLATLWPMPRLATSPLFLRSTCLATCWQHWPAILNWAARVVPTRWDTTGVSTRMCFAWLTSASISL